jgi:hypothetical protein
MAYPVEEQGSQWITVALARRAETAVQVAEVLVSTWQAIDAALSPVIGHRGVAMLYMRSLHVTRTAHPWLTATPEDEVAAMDLATLKSVFVQQSGTHAIAAGGALLQTFHELLSSLIGPSLTERLLRPVWAPFSSGPPAQDTSS